MTVLCYDIWQEESACEPARAPDHDFARLPERAPIFTGTRVPLQALFDDPLDEFLEDFPNVTREHAVAVLEMA
jgi:hypothetical protein